MSKNDELNELFEEWKRHHEKMNIDPKRFCPDGIINESGYAQSHFKILFIMREVNSDKSFDLREMLEEGPKYQMWYTIARWSAGLLHDFPAFEEIDTYETMKDSILKIATMNLKKTFGGAVADLDTINAYAHMDSDFLRRQIQIAEPDMIVACGTFSHLVWLLNLKVNPDKPCSKVSIKEDLKIVPWCHPGRVDNKKIYNGLKKIVQQNI